MYEFCLNDCSQSRFVKYKIYVYFKKVYSYTILNVCTIHIIRCQNPHVMLNKCWKMWKSMTQTHEKMTMKKQIYVWISKIAKEKKHTHAYKKCTYASLFRFAKFQLFFQWNCSTSFICDGVCCCANTLLTESKTRSKFVYNSLSLIQYKVWGMIWLEISEAIRSNWTCSKIYLFLVDL